MGASFGRFARMAIANYYATDGLFVESQIKHIRNTWAMISRDALDNGMTVIIRLFEKNPEFTRYFPSLKGIPLTELREDKKFQANCTIIMYTVGNIIDHLDDKVLLDNVLKIIGKKFKIANISDLQLMSVIDVIIEFLKEKLGPKFKHLTDQVWSSLIDYVYEALKKENVIYIFE